MKHPKGNLVRQVREIIGKTQAEFVALIGGDIGIEMYRKIERGVAPLRRDLEGKIKVATGATLIMSAPHPLYHFTSETYTAKHYKQWVDRNRARYLSTPANQRARGLSSWIEVLLSAADDAGVGHQVMHHLSLEIARTADLHSLRGQVEKELKRRPIKPGVFWAWCPCDAVVPRRKA